MSSRVFIAPAAAGAPPGAAAPSELGLLQDRVDLLDQSQLFEREAGMMRMGDRDADAVAALEADVGVRVEVARLAGEICWRI